MQISRRQFIGLVGALGLGGCARTRELTQQIDPRRPGRLTFAAINDVHVLDVRSTAIVGRAVHSINATPDVAFTVILTVASALSPWPSAAR